MITPSKIKELESADPKADNLQDLHHKLLCSICPPNKGENAKRKSMHGNKKPRYKNKRK